MRRLISLEHSRERQEMTSSSRWMVSYADFMTILFVLFLVLYVSNSKKQAVLPQQARAANSVTEQVKTSHLTLQEDERPNLIRDLRLSLGSLVESESIEMIQLDTGVLIQIREASLFASGTAKLPPTAISLLERISVVLVERQNQLEIEGHTDNLPIRSELFPSNWELSASRAGSVVRVLQEQGVAAARMTAVGKADTSPVADNDTAENRNLNRRVTLLVKN